MPILTKTTIKNFYHNNIVLIDEFLKIEKKRLIEDRKKEQALRDRCKQLKINHGSGRRLKESKLKEK